MDLPHSRLWLFLADGSCGDCLGLLLSVQEEQEKGGEVGDMHFSIKTKFKYSRTGLGGIAGNAALVSALQKSFANQAQYITNTFQIDHGRSVYGQKYSD